MKTRILEVRKAVGKTQDGFASDLGLSKNYVWQLEKGERKPSDRTVLDICRTFHVNEEWLRTGTGEMFIEKDKADRLAEWAAQVSMENDTARRRIVDALVALPEDQWEVLYEFAKKNS